MAMSGIWQIKVDTTVVGNGHSIAAYTADAAGNFINSQSLSSTRWLQTVLSTEYAEDSAHTSGDRGQLVLGVRRDADTSPVSADGDYQTLLFDANGKLKVAADLDVDFDYVYAEDSAASSGDLGAATLLVRQDTLAVSTSADGDYGHFKSNNLGELYVFDTTTHTTLSSLLTELQSVTHAEDAAHVSGDAGIMSLAVRNDAGTALAADGDYIPLTTNSTGALRTTVTGTISFNGQYTEDSAATSGDTGLFGLTVRRDTGGAQTSASGDYAEFQSWSNGELKTVDICNISMLQQQISVATTATALPTTALANRKRLLIQNVDSSASVWVGSATVTASGATGGIEVPKGGHIELEAGPAVTVYAIASGSARTVRVLECA